MKSDLAVKIIDRENRLRSDRSSWESHWEEVATFVAPRQGGITTKRTKGGKVMALVFDTTAIDANDIFAAGMFGHLCQGRWFLLKAKTTGTGNSDAINRWIMDATQILHEELATSNFGQVIHECFKDLGWCGTTCPYEEEGRPGDPTLNFQHWHISTYCIDENSKGLVDTVYRKFSYTARQAVQEWGLENVGKSVRDAYNSNKLDEAFDFIQAIYPREDRDGARLDNKNMQFASVYIAVKDKIPITESGYREFPAFPTRLDKESSEKYGRSIGMKKLPEIKLLNKIVKTTIKAAEKVVDPPLQVPDDGFISPFKTTPGGIMYYKAGRPDRIEPLVTKANIGLGIEMENQRREAIDKAFFVDLFLMLAERKNMTAYEVSERIDEKLIILGPMLGRLQAELFEPLITRSLGILLRAGKLPPVPDGLDAYEIEYVGKLAAALKIIEIRAMTATLQYIAPLANINPAVMDNFDDDRVTRGVSERMGIPGDWLRPFDAVKKLREVRQQETEKMEAMQAAQAAAQAIPGLGKKTDPSSIMGKLMEAGS